MAGLIKRLRDTLPRLSRVFTAFLPRVRPHSVELAGGLVLGMIVAATEVMKPWPLQVVFDLVLTTYNPTKPGKHHHIHGPSALVQPWLQGHSTTSILIAATAAILIISVVGGLAEYGETVVLSNVGQRIVAKLRRDLFRQLMRLPTLFHTSRQQGDLLMRLTGDIVLLRELLVGNILDSVGALLVIIGTLIAMLWMDWRLTLLSLAIVPLVALAGAHFSRKIRDLVGQNRRKEGQLASSAGEALGAIHVLQAFGAADRASKAYEKQNRSSLRSGMKAGRVEAMLARTLDLLTAAGTAVTLLLGATAVARGELTPGSLLVFLTYQRTLFKPVRQLARIAARSAKASACGERVLEVLETPVTVTDEPGAIDCGRLGGAIELDHVTMQYPRGDVALADVSFSVPAGAVAVIRGESGAGKSTLLSLMPRLMDPTGGVIRVDGQDLKRFTLDSLRSQIAIVFQESVLFGMSLRENIALGDPNASPEEVEAAAERAGVMRFAPELPNGLDTVVGERGAQLSGGQRQRVALARAALRNAPILILDEPFSHLDEVSRDHVLAALRTVSYGRTVLLVTHQDHPGFTADVEVVLAGGRVVSVKGGVPPAAVGAGVPA
ncbi:MAG TPA: ABC transporter ATP-binding protein [Candidatus Eisenbacteria bacterium]